MQVASHEEDKVDHFYSFKSTAFWRSTMNLSFGKKKSCHVTPMHESNPKNRKIPTF
jgi:hypothetical protein